MTLAKPSLWEALAPETAPVFVLSGCFHLLSIGCTLAQPLLLQQIVKGLSCGHASSTDDGTAVGCASDHRLYGWAAVLACTTLIGNVLSSHERMLLTVLGLRVRAQLVGAVYRKTLNLSSGALQAETAGRIVTITSNDCQKLLDFLPLVHELWAAPLLITITVYLLFTVLGWAAVAGMVVIVAAVPTTGNISRRLQRLRRSLVTLADERVSLVGEVIAGIKVIKARHTPLRFAPTASPDRSRHAQSYAWEGQFAARITDARSREVAVLWKVSKLSAFFGVLLFTAPVLTAVASIGTYSLTGVHLTAEALYTSLSLFSIIRFPMAFFPNVVVQQLNARVAMERITAFLAADESEDPSAFAAVDAAVAPGCVRITGPVEFVHPAAPPPAQPPAPRKGRRRVRLLSRAPAPMPDASASSSPHALKRGYELLAENGGGDGGGGDGALHAIAPAARQAALQPFALSFTPATSVNLAPGTLAMVVGPGAWCRESPQLLLDDAEQRGLEHQRRAAHA